MATPHPKTKLKKWRKSEGISLRRAAELCNCDPSMIAHIEAGRRLPGRRLANAFKKLVRIQTEEWDRYE